MSQQEQETEIIESIFPEIRQFYRDNPSLIYWPTPRDKNHKFFCEATADNPVTHRIDQLYRMKSGDSEVEKIYYYETLLAKDQTNNVRTFDWVIGRVEKPVAHYDWDSSTGKNEATSIEYVETVYPIDFNDKNLKEILPNCTPATRYFVDDTSNIWTTTRKNFLEASFQQCVTERPTRRADSGQA